MDKKQNYHYLVFVCFEYFYLSVCARTISLFVSDKSDRLLEENFGEFCDRVGFDALRKVQEV